jgi:biopolymer transport protein ExbD
MDFKYRPKIQAESELEITSFMSLMIVLVPVLLVSIAFTQIRVFEVNLPPLTGGSGLSPDEQSNLEVRIQHSGFQVSLDDQVVQEIPVKETEAGKVYDYAYLSQTMQAIKEQLGEKRDIVVISTLDVDYQNLVFTMEAVKSYKTVVATSVVEIELFPEISLGDTTVVDEKELQTK